MKNSKGSKLSDEYGTPQKLFDVYNEEFDFQLDVCASNKNHKCDEFYTAKEDGLRSPWVKRNWCNPPYSKILPWVNRAYEYTHSGMTTVCLVKHDPSTRHGKLISQYADELRIVENRIQFDGATLGANFPSAFAIFRPRLFTRKTDARILYVDYREVLK